MAKTSDGVLRPVFWSLGLGLEGLRSRLSLGLEGFRSRSRDFAWVIFYEVLQGFP